jgi:hypothetical protein
MTNESSIFRSHDVNGGKCRHEQFVSKFGINTGAKSYDRELQSQRCKNLQSHD